MGDVSSEPTMEEILSSIKRVIEESESTSPTARPRRAAARPAVAEPAADASDEVLELNERVPQADIPRMAAPAAPAAMPEPAAPVAPAAAPAEPILSAVAAQASREPLEALSRLVVKPDTPGADTLEGLVREMLRPMLRDWLDAHLPGIVESMVAREIARISGRGL